MIADFEITHDQEFLYHFFDKKDIFYFSPKMVEKLRNSNDPYGRYGYGCWLYITGAESVEDLRTVRDCFEYAANNGIADAWYRLSQLYHNGDYVNDEKGIMELNRLFGTAISAAAEEKGSELVKIRKCYNRYFDLADGVGDAEALIAEVKEHMNNSGAPLRWLELLGCIYHLTERYDEAIEAFEKCIDGGLLYPTFDLAMIYSLRGNKAYYESLMEEGVEKGISTCMAYGYEDEEHWGAYDAETRDAIYKRLSVNLKKGIELGDFLSYYCLADYLMRGAMGFEKNIAEAFRYARKGMSLGYLDCFRIALKIIDTEDVEAILPKELLMSDEEILMARLRALRWGGTEMLKEVIAHSGEYEAMGYADEIEYWEKVWESTPDKEEDTAAGAPTVLVVHPTGFVDFVETAPGQLSFESVAELIDADGCDAVHYSAALDRITKDCGLGKNVAFYVDRNAIAKDLPDNAVATMLYGHGYEIRGAIVVALEDKKYNTCPLDAEEAYAVYDAINEFTGGLLQCDAPDDDGRHDAWA